MCDWELVKRYALGAAFLLFCIVLGWFAISLVGSNLQNEYLAGIMGGVVTGFFVLYYDYAIIRYKKKKTRKWAIGNRHARPGSPF